MKILIALNVILLLTSSCYAIKIIQLTKKQNREIQRFQQLMQEIYIWFEMAKVVYPAPSLEKKHHERIN